jgi:hypothetical protein
MLIDIVHFPFIWLRDGPDDAHDGALKRALLAYLLDLRQRFVMIAERPPRLSELDRMTPEEQAMRDRFFEARKSDFEAYCAGMIVVGRGAWLPVPVRSALQGISRSIGVPLHFVDNELMALELARERLRH